MKLADLFQRYEPSQVEFLAESRLRAQSSETEISGIFFDHRKVLPQSVFVALRGGQTDGHRFLKDALEAGACVLIVEAKDGAQALDLFRRELGVEHLDSRILYAFSSSTRHVLAKLAAAFYDFPSRDLFTVAVTGTNGKTTSTHMIEHVLNALGKPTGVIGTIDHHLGEKIWTTSMTTPDAVELQGRLRQFSSAGAKAVSLEASSHALDQCRLDGVDFDFAAFTNLTRDHLDYHQAMDLYFQAKYRLFHDLLVASAKNRKFAIFHMDDLWCSKAHHAFSQMLSATSDPNSQADSNELATIQIIGFGTHQNCDLRYEVEEQGFGGVRFRIWDFCLAGKKNAPTVTSVKISMPGYHNVQNAMIAYAAGIAAGGKVEDVVAALGNLVGVKGRLERVPNNRDVHVFVDYAHSDDSLRSILAMLDAIRQDIRAPHEALPGVPPNKPSEAPANVIAGINGISESKGFAGASRRPRIITVFGCGGDRDRGKRPLMMRAALDGSDEVILTSDNPRTEDPEKILDDAMQAVSTAEHVKVRRYVDRKTAILKAFEICRPGDVVLIAGKGHETTQQIGQVKYPFSDAQVAREILEGEDR